MGDTVMTQSIQRMIGDAREAARKKGVAELADACKGIYGEYPPLQADVEIRKVLSVIDANFLRSAQPHARRGGVSAVAAVACTIPRQLQHDPKLFSAITSTLLPHFKDIDPQVRLLAVEGMMNVLAHLKRNALDSCFANLFPAMLIVAADRETKIQHATAELSNVVKEVAAENPKSFIMHEFVEFVKQGLTNTKSPDVINFIHQWITISQSIPVPNQLLIHYLGEFLKPLLHLVNFGQHTVASRTEKILQAFMVVLKKEHRAGRLLQLQPKVEKVQEAGPPTAGGGGAIITPVICEAEDEKTPAAEGADGEADPRAATAVWDGNKDEGEGEEEGTTDEEAAPPKRLIENQKKAALTSPAPGAADTVPETSADRFDLVHLMETTLEAYNTSGEPRTREISSVWTRELLTIGQGVMFPISHRILGELIKGISDTQNHAVVETTRKTLDEFAELLQKLHTVERTEGVQLLSGEDLPGLASPHTPGDGTPREPIPTLVGAAAASSGPEFHGSLNDIAWPEMVSALVDSLNSPQPSRLELLQWAVLINLLRPEVIAEQFDFLFPSLMGMLDDPDSQVLYRTIEVLSIIAGEEKFSTFIGQLLDALEGSKELLSKANIIFKRLQSIYTVHAPPPAVSSQVALDRARQQKDALSHAAQQQAEKDGGGGSVFPTPTNNDCDGGVGRSSQPPTPVSNSGRTGTAGGGSFKGGRDRGSPTPNSLSGSHSNNRRGLNSLPATDQSEKVFLQTAKLLGEHPNKQFAATLVVTLTAMLLTAREFTCLREVLKCASVSTRARDAFVGLYPSWCYNPVSAIALCLLTKTYDHAYTLVVEVGSRESSIHTLVQLDRLVQLLEAPVFAFVRLALLQPRQNASLVQALFGIQMILPQGSPQFKLLQQRLVAVTAVANLGPNAEKAYYQQQQQQQQGTTPSSAANNNSTSGAVRGGADSPGAVPDNTGTSTSVDWALMSDTFKLKQLEMAHYEYQKRSGGQ